MSVAIYLVCNYNKANSQKERMNVTQFLCSILLFLAIFGLFANAESGKKQDQQTQLGYETNNPMVCVCSKLSFFTIHGVQCQFKDLFELL